MSFLDMEASTLALASGGFASLSGALLVRAAIAGASRFSEGTRWSQHHMQLARDLIFVRAGMSARTVTTVQCIVLVLACAALFENQPVSLVLLLGALSPHFLLRRARAQRVSLIEKQIEGWMGSLGRALEAAPSLGEAIEVSITMCDAPLREELKVVVNEIHLGRPIDKALSQWSQRVDSRTLTMALSTLQVGRETGGKLGDVLKSAADSLREMERLEGVLRTKTAEGRAQAWVISIVPFPLYLAVQTMDPSYFLPLQTTASGHIMMAIAAALWIAAAFSARKILAVRI